jgi:hypothetical protein
MTPETKPWTAGVHFHHMYSTDRHDLNHARKLLLLLYCLSVPYRTLFLIHLQGHVLHEMHSPPTDGNHMSICSSPKSPR